MSKQHKASDRIVVGYRFGCDQYGNAGEKAQEIARTCHGLQTWEGVKDVEGPSGLRNLANAYLRKITTSGAIVTENVYGDGTSRYYPSWK